MTTSSFTRACPPVFDRLMALGSLHSDDIRCTDDGFFAVCRSISDLLAHRGITDFPDPEAGRLPCCRFFDDWYLYAVSSGSEYIYGLFKLREQEHDAPEDGPADGDDPGVTISFIAFSAELLADCLAYGTDMLCGRLSEEINRVVASGGQLHHDVLKHYFLDPHAKGSYLVACLYARFIASLCTDGRLNVPAHYRELAELWLSGQCSAKDARLPRFIQRLNERSGDIVCDHRRIYFRSADFLSEAECNAILATHTGNTSLHSFAAEVEYHTRFLSPITRVKIPLLGRSIYDSAVRADMSIDDSEFEGPAPYHRPDSPIVLRQQELHPAEEFFPLPR